MNEFQIMPNDYAMGILTTAWRITKRHYEIILGSTLFILVVAIALSRIPYVEYLASLPLLFLSVGQMYIVRQLIDGKPTKFSDMFRPLQDPKWMNSLLPLGIAGVAIAIAEAGISKLMLSGGAFLGFAESMLSLTLTLVWIALTAFSGPLIAFKNKSFQESIGLNISATTANWQPLLILTAYTIGVLLLCLIMLVIPVVFIAIPIIYVMGYLTYASMFEGLNVVALAERYKDKPTMN